MSDASSKTELRCVGLRRLSQACPPSQTQNIVHPNLEQLHRMSCTISGGADILPDDSKFCATTQNPFCRNPIRRN